jgi:virginiamycin A acetyltransferase
MKSLLKSTVKAVCLILVLPQVAIYRLAAMVMSPERAFPSASQFLSLMPGFLGVYLRNAFYRSSLPAFGDDVCLSFGALLTHPDTRIGPFTYVGGYSILGRVTIERDVLIGSFVSIMNGSRQHGIDRFDLPVREQPGEWPLVTIGADSWIGDHAVIMADVGRHCVVAAGAIVTRPVPDYAIVAGSPAHILRYRNQPETATCATDAPASPALPTA